MGTRSHTDFYLQSTDSFLMFSNNCIFFNIFGEPYARGSCVWYLIYLLIANSEMFTVSLWYLFYFVIYTLAGTWLTLWTQMRKKDRRYLLSSFTITRWFNSIKSLLIFFNKKHSLCWISYHDLCNSSILISLTLWFTVQNIALYSELYLISCVQGKTVEVGRAHFETEHTRFTILDAPVFFHHYDVYNVACSTMVFYIY
jgi:hypothetical protein